MRVQSRAELLLERIPLTTEYKANKVIILNLNNFINVTISIPGCVHGRRERAALGGDEHLQSDGHEGAPQQQHRVRHGLGAKFTTFLADKLLSEYANSGIFSSTDLLDNLGAKEVLRY